ncbi:MAG: penicillin-binding protein 2 [Kiritimatiellae bacterium]|nr:penicillin-binding protein 2 [Kiritimatiellia bacterium]
MLKWWFRFLEKYDKIIRYTLVFLALAGAGGLVMRKVAYAHWGSVPIVEERPEYKYDRKIEGVWALRGSIYCADGTPLAESIIAWDYYVDPSTNAVNPKEVRRMDVVTNVAEQLNLPLDKVIDVYCRTSGRNHFLCRSTDTQAHDALVGYKPHTWKRKAPGLIARDRYVRKYPQGEMMAQIVGFILKDPTNAVGNAGIEMKFESSLRGTPGRIVGAKTKSRNELPEKRILKVDAKRGADVHLTVLANLQMEVEEALRDACETYHTDMATAVVMDVHTGRIYAMASLPAFLPDKFNSKECKERKGQPNNPHLNRAIAVNYEPGSVMKPLTAAAALTEGVCTPEKEYDIGTSGVLYRYGARLKDHATGKITVADAIARSSNIAFALIGEELGAQRLYDYFTKFGLTERTDIDLPGEQHGILSKVALLYKDKLKVTRVPIGQGVAVTALQLARAYAMFGNGGRLVKPYIVDRIEQEDGEIIYEGKPEVVAQPISEKVAKQVLTMMRGVVESRRGTGRRARVKGYSVAGKTGTAQMPSRTGGYSEDDYNTTFAGIIPAENPKVVIVVNITKPIPTLPPNASPKARIGRFVDAGKITGPTFSRIAAAAMMYLEIEPDKPGEVMDDDDDD